MVKRISCIFMLALLSTLFTGCGAKQNNMTPDAKENGSAVSKTQSVSGEHSKSPEPTEAATNIDNSSGQSKETNNSSQSEKADTIISEEEAKNIALKDANLAESEISGLRIKQERDDGIQKYEVDFYSNSREYDYDIDAISGKILEKEEEPID